MTELTATAAEPFDPTEIEGHTPDFRTELAAQLAELAPEAVADGKIDVDKLKELLEGDADDTSERFGLFWPGKKRAIRAAQTPTAATLAPDYNNSKNWDNTQNVFIEGDNLEVLKILQKHYHGKIKMIYIDPPYNTGKDFVYPDNFKEGVDNYLQWSKQVNEEGKPLSTNTETGGRIHTNWLNMMYPRLKLARNLLTDDGVIFISIDDHEVKNALALVGEIFGEQNVSPTLIRQKKKKPSFLHANMGTMTEYVLCILRNKNAAFPFSVSQTTAGKKYPLNNAGNARTTLTFPAGSIEFNLPDQVIAPQDMSEGNIHTVLLTETQIENGRNANEFSLEGEWRYSQKTLNEIVESGEKITISKIPFRPNHVKAGGEIKKLHNFIAPSTYGVGTNEDASAEVAALLGTEYFQNPKPVSLIEHLTKAVTYDSRDATVLDFFSGSGTTAHAVMQLNAEDGGNRKHIQVQLPEPTEEGSEARKAGYNTIADIARQRIRRAGEKIEADYADQLAQRDTPLDTGFRAYKLVDTNFTKWDIEPGAPLGKIEEHLFDLRDSANDDATTDAILTELLLKQGMSLTEHVTDTTIAGLNCKAITDSDGDPVLLAYVDEHNPPTIDQLRAMVGTKPARLVILEDCFQGNDELKTNLKQMCATNNIELKTA